MNIKQKLEKIIEEGENKSVDFKRQLNLSTATGKSEFIKDIVSLANSSKDVAYLLIGIDDDKSIVGIDAIEEERIQQIIQIYINPALEIHCLLIKSNTEAPKYVGIIEVCGAERPYKITRTIDRLNQNEVFVRHGSIISKASPEEILDMYNSSSRYKKINDYISSAEVQLKIGNHNKAIEYYSEAIDVFPTAHLLLSRAKIYRLLSLKDISSYHHKSAVKYLSNALTINKLIGFEKEIRVERLRLLSDRGSYFDLWEGDLNWAKSNLKNAELGEIFYLEANRINQNDYLFEEEGEYALELLNNAINLNFRTMHVYFLRAEANCGLSNYYSALKDINKAEELYISENCHVSFGDLIGLKSCILFRMRKFNEVYDVLEKATQEYRKMTLSTSPLNLSYFDMTFEIENEIICRYAIDQKFGPADCRSNIDFVKKLFILLNNYHQWFGHFL